MRALGPAAGALQVLRAVCARRRGPGPTSAGKHAPALQRVHNVGEAADGPLLRQQRCFSHYKRRLGVVCAQLDPRSYVQSHHSRARALLARKSTFLTSTPPPRRSARSLNCLRKQLQNTCGPGPTRTRRRRGPGPTQSFRRRACRGPTRRGAVLAAEQGYLLRLRSAAIPPHRTLRCSGGARRSQSWATAGMPAA